MSDWINRDGPDAWPLGTWVCKISGAEWVGRVIGHYDSELTPEGLIIECTALGACRQVHVEPAKRMQLIDPDQPEGIIERAARKICDDPDARRIAKAEDEPCYDDSNEEVQHYWKLIAAAALGIDP